MMTIEELQNKMNGNHITKQQPQLLYLNKSQLKEKNIYGFNLLEIIEQNWKRNSQNLICIDMTKSISIQMSPYAQILQVFLTIPSQMGYHYLIID